MLKSPKRRVPENVITDYERYKEHHVERRVKTLVSNAMQRKFSSIFLTRRESPRGPPQKAVSDRKEALGYDSPSKKSLFNVFYRNFPGRPQNKSLVEEATRF